MPHSERLDCSVLHGSQGGILRFWNALARKALKALPQQNRLRYTSPRHDTAQAKQGQGRGIRGEG